ncbi:MAG: hypothetical protein COB77_00245 [Gammaproteobacteria bacterium]|nr:MAG: hypothetical protein COB77_00245 [Gammaproteobacteria bacterium]
MKNITRIILLALALVMTAQLAYARELPAIANSPDGKKLEIKRGIIETTNAMESASLRISLGSDLHGFVEGKVCDYCETIKVIITPETKAYKNNIEVPLIRAKNRIGRFATVFYELETKNVRAIRW